ncbi:MAG: hypothetical protein LCH87_14615 [Actinobacteria bacterium]|nr:hypothetical protein [Actinomycetota bacterium]
MGFFTNFFGSTPKMPRNLSARPAQTVGAVVVSATDGPMPITLKEMRDLAATGSTSVRVHLVDVSLVDDEELVELVELELRAIASDCGFTQVDVEWYA